MATNEWCLNMGRDVVLLLPEGPIHCACTFIGQWLPALVYSLNSPQIGVPSFLQLWGSPSLMLWGWCCTKLPPTIIRAMVRLRECDDHWRLPSAPTLLWRIGLMNYPGFFLGIRTTLKVILNCPAANMDLCHYPQLLGKLFQYAPVTHLPSSVHVYLHSPPKPSLFPRLDSCTLVFILDLYFCPTKAPSALWRSRFVDIRVWFPLTEWSPLFFVMILLIIMYVVTRSGFVFQPPAPIDGREGRGLDIMSHSFIACPCVNTPIQCTSYYATSFPRYFPPWFLFSDDSPDLVLSLPCLSEKL